MTDRAEASRATSSLQWLMRKTGRSTEIDPTIPPRDLAGEVTARALELSRGLLRFRRAVFLGRSVRVRGRRALTLGRLCAIGSSTLVDARGTLGVQLGDQSRLGSYGTVTTTSHLSRRGVGLSLGSGSGIGDFFHIGASGGVTIGSNVIVGPYFSVHSQEHNYSDTTKPIRSQGTREAPIVVGDDCWIGSKVTLLAGTTLGAGTVVASGAVVKGSFPSNVVLGGIPARIIRRRDDESDKP